MTIQTEYANDGKRITQPGKFEGEPLFAPRFWGMAIEGFADSDDGKIYKFKFTTAELAEPGNEALRAWLGRARVLRMHEDSQGFVHCW